MTKPLRMLQLFSWLVILVCLPGHGSAAIKITITDGPNTLDPNSRVDGFVLSVDSGAGKTTTLAFLKCNARPCKVYFPSGKDSEQNGDTFVFRDAPNAQVVKMDASDTDRLVVGGVEIEALVAGNKDLTFIFQTEQGDLNPPPASTGSSSYPLEVKFTGTFKDAGNTNRAQRCTWPARLPWCARLQLVVTGLPGSYVVNDKGLIETATAAISCKATGDSPCGTGGYYASYGEFWSEDRKTHTCGSSCTPWLTATLSIRFGAKGEKLTLDPSGIAVSNIMVDNFGVAELFSATADQASNTNSWVWFSAANESYRADPKIKLAGSKITITSAVEKASSVPAVDGVSLTSIATIGEGETPGDGAGLLPPSEQARNDRSYASFIPPPPSWQDLRLPWAAVNQLVLRYEYVMHDSEPGDLRLPSPLRFSECTNGSFRVVIALSDAKGNAGFLNLYLGSADNVTTGCSKAASALSGKNLMANSEPRIDPSQLDQKRKCCMTVNESKTLYGDRFVRWISVVVDQGVPKTDAPRHYKVNLHDAIVNSFVATKDLTVVDPNTFMPLKGAEIPAGASSVVISNTSAWPYVSTAPIDDGRIKLVGNELFAEIDAAELPGGASGTYRVNLCLFGGQCVPREGTFTK